MNNKLIRFGPSAISVTVTCFISPGTVTGAIPVQNGNGGGAGTPIVNTYYDIRHIRIVNTTSTQRSVSGFIAGTSTGSGAGQAFLGSGLAIPANDYEDYYGETRIDAGEYMNFIGDSAGLTVEAEGEVGVQ